MAAGSVGLTLERAQLAADLTKQILDTQQAGLGGVEATLGLLLAAAVLQHAGRFFDDAATILRAGVQHCIDLPLADDDVLLTADTGIAEQFLHIEQAAVDAVDRVLALTCAEQRARDRDLGELDRQQPRRVVERERDLGAAERRTLGRTGEDDIVHLLAAHRTGRLGTQHPGNRIDHIRLARPVRADDDSDARLQLERGGVGERLETFEGERLQEHGGTTLVAATGASQQARPRSPVSGQDSSHFGFREGFVSVSGTDSRPDPGGEPQSSSAGYCWQRGQKWVPRPPKVTLRISALPHEMHR
ncbi:unannotated protein [freshwater metagenome]|uniref:Unannotated protein n=1 Tax=freshwater metagenome TaxID=449393 RepID=A0A6J7CDQ6_9ZZZZ